MGYKPTVKQTTKNGVKGSDFILLEKPKPQANVVVFGPNGNGKSTFVTEYAPDPIAFISLDRRGDHAVFKATEKGRKIYFLRVDMPANPSKLDDVALRKVGQAAVNKVINNFEWAVEQSRTGGVRTICIDTGTEYAEMLNMAITGRVDRVKGDYGKSKDLINREFWRLYNLAREGNAHFVMLARAAEIWVANEPSGRFKPRGPDVISDAADWCGMIRLKRAGIGKKARTKKEFELEITKAGTNIDELGAVYTQEDWNVEFEDDTPMGPFCYATWKQFIETSDPEDWR